MNEEQPMAVDEIIAIENWLNEIRKSLDSESISYGEIAQLDHVYDSVKIFIAEAK